MSGRVESAAARRRRRAWRLIRMLAPIVAVAVVLWLKPMGLLLWARLRILTSIPRTAMAEEPPEWMRSFPDLASRPLGSGIPPTDPAGPPDSDP